MRLIAATRRNLDNMVQEGTFREDLFFRLNAIPLRLPPIAGRIDDIKVFLDHFLKIFSQRFNKRVKDFGPRAHRALLHYRYPGNIRELRNIVEFAVGICDSDHIGISHLPEHVTNDDYTPLGLDEIKSARRPVGQKNLESVNWASTERRMIIEAMKKAGGRRSKAAALLGWARSTLWRKLKQYGIES